MRSGCKMCVGGGLVGDVFGDFVGREAAIVGGEAGMALSFDGICFGAFAVAVEFGESLVDYGKYVAGEFAVLCNGYVVVEYLCIILVEKITVVVHASEVESRPVVALFCGFFACFEARKESFAIYRFVLDLFTGLCGFDELEGGEYLTGCLAVAAAFAPGGEEECDTRGVFAKVACYIEPIEGVGIVDGSAGIGSEVEAVESHSSRIALEGCLPEVFAGFRKVLLYSGAGCVHASQCGIANAVLRIAGLEV